MSQVLDQILKKQIVAGPEMVSSDYATESVRIDNREDEFSIQLDYDNGVSVGMQLQVEVSNDGNTFVAIPDTFQEITDPSGTHIWDITGGGGTTFFRVGIIVATGSIDVLQILYVGKRRH